MAGIFLSFCVGHLVFESPVGAQFETQLNTMKGKKRVLSPEPCK